MANCGCKGYAPLLVLMHSHSLSTCLPGLLCLAVGLAEVLVGVVPL